MAYRFYNRTKKVTRKSVHSKKIVTATEKEKTVMPIEDLCYDFSKRIVGLYSYLTKTSDNKEFILSKQVLRSGTSIGANICESRHAQSDVDFLSKISIAHKESEETRYWLRLLFDTGYIPDVAAQSIIHDCTRIIAILSASVKTMKRKVGK